MAQKKITDLTLRSSFDGTCNLPIDDATQTYRVTGSQLLDFVKSTTSKIEEISNLTLSTSVASNALTIAVKTKAGTNPSSTDPVTVSMRSATLSSGLYYSRSITASLSLVISSGSTLGQVSAQPSNIYVYLIDNAGSLELAASHAYYPENLLVSTTTEGSSGGADSATAIYSTTGRSTVPIRLIGTILNTQATAGTWTSAGTQIQLKTTEGYKLPNIQKFTSGSGTCFISPGAKYIRVKMVGGGGGGGGSGNTTNSTVAGAGGTGGTSYFRIGASPDLLVANGGVGGTATATNPGGAGGTASLGTGPIGSAYTGGAGQGGALNQTAAVGITGSPGGNGAASPFGGAGSGGYWSGAGNAAVANTGSGGGGGGASLPNATTQVISGAGGGASGFIDALILSNSAAFAAGFDYAVGAAGTAGTAGSNGFAGGAGSSGIIIVEEYFQ